MKSVLVFVVVLLVHLHTCCGSEHLHKFSDLVLQNDDVEEEDKKPPHDQYAKAARWLMHETTWGVLATTNGQGNPFSNVVSHSDNKTGVPFFYLSELDETARDLLARPMAAFTVAAASLRNECKSTDPEDPTCWKLTTSGRVMVAENQEEAKRILFEKHPQMESWPQGHGFTAFKMEIESIFFLDYYGGAHKITPEAYFNA